MRPIHLADLDKSRPVVILTRELALATMTRVTVAPITTSIRGLSTEVRVGEQNGLERDSVISLDNVVTMPKSAIGRFVGVLGPDQERALAESIVLAYDLDL